MRQAKTAKWCLDLAKSGRFTVPVLSTAGFNRPLLALSTICCCPSRSKERSWPRKPRESGECRGKGVDGYLEDTIMLEATCWRLDRCEIDESAPKKANRWNIHRSESKEI